MKIFSDLAELEDENVITISGHEYFYCKQMVLNPCIAFHLIIHFKSERVPFLPACIGSYFWHLLNIAVVHSTKVNVMVPTVKVPMTVLLGRNKIFNQSVVILL